MRIDRIKLISEMARQNLRVNELAEKAGVSTNTVSAIRCGKNCSKLAGNAIAKALNVDVTELLED